MLTVGAATTLTTRVSSLSIDTSARGHAGLPSSDVTSRPRRPGGQAVDPRPPVEEVGHMRPEATPGAEEKQGQSRQDTSPISAITTATATASQNEGKLLICSVWFIKVIELDTRVVNHAGAGFFN